MSDENIRSDSVALEKQKTIRMALIVVATLILAIGGFYVMTRSDGKSNMVVDLHKGTFTLSLDKPVVEQGNVRTKSVTDNGKDIPVTEGVITNSAVVGQLNVIQQASPTQFTGKNFINKNERFLFTAPHPEYWQIAYNQAGLQDPNIPINYISNPEGAHLNIWREQVPAGTTIEQYVAFKVMQMTQAGLILRQPLITYDLPSGTAFLIITNPVTMGQSYIKMVLEPNRNSVFGATANYNQAISTPRAIQDLVTMVSTFTLF